MSEPVAQPAAAAAAPAQAPTLLGDEPAIASTAPADVPKETTPAVVVPEKYDFKQPEGALLSKEHVDSLAQYAKAEKLTAEQAQKLYDREHGAVASFVKSQNDALAAKVKQWESEAKADPVIGGEKFVENLELAKRGLATAKVPNLAKFLNDSGYGSHPEVLRVFAMLGRNNANDSLVKSGAQEAGQRSDTELFYGKKEA